MGPRRGEPRAPEPTVSAAPRDLSDSEESQVNSSIRSVGATIAHAGLRAVLAPRFLLMALTIVSLPISAARATVESELLIGLGAILVEVEVDLDDSAPPDLADRQALRELAVSTLRSRFAGPRSAMVRGMPLHGNTQPVPSRPLFVVVRLFVRRIPMTESPNPRYAVFATVTFMRLSPSLEPMVRPGAAPYISFTSGDLSSVQSDVRAALIESLMLEVVNPFNAPPRR
jgi:hypothetical protein